MCYYVAENVFKYSRRCDNNVTELAKSDVKRPKAGETTGIYVNALAKSRYNDGFLSKHRQTHTDLI